MDFKEFSKLAMVTESKIEQVNVNTEALYYASLAALNAAELLDQIKKNVFYGKPFKVEKIDVAVSQLAVCNFNFPEIEPLENGKTIIPKEALNPRVFHAILGMVTESVELLQAMFVSIQNGVMIDVVNISEELGDFDWYKAILCDELELDEDEIRAKVIAKLKARYGDKFDAAKAITRDLNTEREILETSHHPV